MLSHLLFVFLDGDVSLHLGDVLHKYLQILQIQLRAEIVNVLIPVYFVHFDQYLLRCLPLVLALGVEALRKNGPESVAGEVILANSSIGFIELELSQKLDNDLEPRSYVFG